MVLLLPLLLYSFLIIPYLGTIPYLDGNTEFKIAHNFLMGNYLSNWTAYHPPLKPILFSGISNIFGLWSYTMLGYLLGLTGIISIYFIAKKMFDKKTAMLSAVFLALSGLYVATSLFSLNDFIMTVLILVSFVYYLKKKFLYYALFVSLAVCAKESAILFPCSIVLIELFHKKFRWENIIPLLILLGWMLFLRLTGHSLWNSWNFSDNHHHGIVYTFFNNVITLKIFNKYAYDNWLHLFVFNYNWVFWLLAAITIIKDRKNMYVQMLVTFALAYALVILSFQTFTITRYVLPILPFVYILAAFCLVQLKQSLFAIIIVLFVVVSALFTSNDPVSNHIWGRTVKLDEELYIRSLDGNDGIAYNMQFLHLVKKRDTILRSGEYDAKLKVLDVDKATLKYYKINK